MLEKELKKLKDLVNKLIESVENKINSLIYLDESDIIKNEKVLTDILKKLVGLTIEINKSLLSSNKEINLIEDDLKIIEQFYHNYDIKTRKPRK